MAAEDQKDEAFRLAGDRLGKFVILSELGRGAMGVVYEAFQEDLKRKVALKILPANIALDAKQVRRFKREAESAAKLHHDNVVPIFEVGEIDRTHYFTMALIEGRHFGAVRARDDAEIREAARISRDAARGLAHAHENKVIHRDIKPSNLLLDRGGRVYVSDFGLARLTESQSLTSTDAIVGTPKYMAPEQILARPEGIDGRADIYSLGATLYEVLTGRPPIEAPSVQAFIAAVLEERPPNPRRFNRVIPHDLATIVLRCLEKSPAARYASMTELADDLDRFLAGERIRARPKGAVARGIETVRRHRVIAALCALSLVAILAALVLSGSTQRAQAEQVVKNRIAEALAERDVDLAIERMEELKRSHPLRPDVFEAVRSAYARRAAARLESTEAPGEETLRDLERAGQEEGFWGLLLLVELRRTDEARAAALRRPDGDPLRDLVLARIDVEERAFSKAAERLADPPADAHPILHLTLGEAHRGLAGADPARAEAELRSAEAALLEASRRAGTTPERWLQPRIQVALNDVQTRLGATSRLGELTTILGGVAQEALRNLTGFWARMTKRDVDVVKEFVRGVLTLSGEPIETLPAVLERRARERLREAAASSEVVKANLLLAVANLSVGLVSGAADAFDSAEAVPDAPDDLLPYVFWGRSLLLRAEDRIAEAVRLSLIALDQAAISPGFPERAALFRSALVLWDEARRRQEDKAAGDAAAYLSGWMARNPSLAKAPDDLLERLTSAVPPAPPR